ncbi:hypothetical protein FVEN_g8122 [Fusarium venenatum]|uniref:Fructose-bisphosphate aldolase n=1 Tax=Fusarium venenatum TaxID=56646 RepID=A0A2L2SUL4_9HYPO|nr:uncharacterized protein FVRRES_04524 [Fusarium venenatum]KAG8353868.1 hypothetical protein FVEN_g8122 [Fusarium venenatum]CEI60088.1 unnamed protein product [Fusarium venenatum]
MTPLADIKISSREEHLGKPDGPDIKTVAFGQSSLPSEIAHLFARFEGEKEKTLTRKMDAHLIPIVKTTITWDPQNNITYQILKATEEGGYGAVAPIVYNIEHILAFVQAAEVKRSPLVIHGQPPLRHYHGWHEQLRNGGKLGKDKRTGFVLPCARNCGIATEAEPERIEGGEDGIADTADLEGALTTGEQVEDFIATAIDFLAPAFGNAHDEYGKRGPVLEFNRLDNIRARVNGRVRVVLHGTNDFPENVMKACIKGGVSKINVNKLVLDDHLIHVKEQSSKLNLTALMEQGVEKAQKLTEWQMDVCGSTRKVK